MYPDPAVRTTPALPLQRGMIAAGLRDPAAGTDVIQCVQRFAAPFDAEAYLAAWRRAIERHPILRTRFRWRADGEAEQWAGPAADVPVIADLADTAGTAGGTAPTSGGTAPTSGGFTSSTDLAAFLAADRRAGVDPVSGPPLRVRALPGGVVVATFHHAILDGRSLAILLSEIDDDYASGGTAVFPDRPEFADYARWYAERTAPDHPLAVADREFWARELADLPEPGLLPLEHNGSATPVMGVAAADLSDAETAAVRTLAAAAGVTVNTVVLAAWGLVLATHARGDEAVFGVTRAARHGSVPGAEDMVGLLLATVPLRLPVDLDAPVAEWLRTVRERSVGARDHQLAPLPDIQRAAGHDQLMRSLVLFEHREINTVLSARPTAPAGRTVRILRSPGYAMTLYAFAEPHLSVQLIHDVTRFPDWAPDALLGQFRELLAGMAEAPERPVRELTEPRGAELVRLLEKWNDTAVEYPADATVPALFAEQVRLRPDADAVHSPDGWLSYAELDRRSNRLARTLLARGARPDEPVGLALPRGADLVTAMLAVVKTGAAYLPLDPANPAARDAVALRESGTRLVVTDRERPLPEGVSAVPVSAVDGSDEPLPARAHPLGVAYVNYTSGSTGRPKGVAVPHRGVVRLVTRPTFAEFGPGQTFLHLSATAFDLTTLEVWGALLTGGRVVAAPEGPPDPAVLGALVREHGVSVLWLTAGLFHQLVAHAPEVLEPVAQLLAGGDVLAPDAVRAALVARGGKPVVNGYGPTENTTFTSCCVVTDPRQVGASVPIGTPIQRSTVYVLDEWMRPVPVGVPGELYTGGAGLARGYWANPALTADKFVPDPFGAPGGRLYRTGDLARWRPDGVLEFLGRADQQVKVRGFLVEPAEVESALRECAGVVEALVLPSGEGEARHLVAYVTGEVDVPAVRRHIADRLPAYLCPAQYVVLPELPLNRSGKVDRAALRALRSTGRRAGTPPAEGTQRRLAGLWQALLGVEDVSAEDDFFAVGGNSLLAVRLAFRVRDEFGVDVPVAELHRARTLAACAAVVDGTRNARTLTTITRRDRTAYRVPAPRKPAEASEASEGTGPVEVAKRAEPATSVAPADHLVVPRGTGQWAVWRWVELRGTGFGIEPLLAVASPRAARAAEAVIAADDVVGEARWAAFKVLRTVEDAAEGEERAKLRRVGRLVRKGRFAEARAALDGPAEVDAALAAAALAAARHEAALAHFTERFEACRANTAEVLHQISGDPKFREAVAWQNPRALQTAVDALHKTRSKTRNVDYRRWEHTVVSYLQRYCAKNDTIGFFGPVGWARVEDDAEQALSVRPGPDLVDRRTVYLENWAVHELAEALTTDAVRPWAVPRRMPFIDVDHDTLHVPLADPITLPPLDAAVLGACDGRRRAVDIADHLGADRDTVLETLDRLRQAKRIAWTMEVPPSALRPELALREQIERIGDPDLRDGVGAKLTTVERARDAITRAVGDPDRLVAAIGDLQEEFTAITGAEAVRRPGLFYAGRTLVHEECRRDLEVTLSPALLDTLWPALELVLEAARWFTRAGAALYTRALHEVFRQNAAGRTEVRLADFWLWANDAIFRLDDRLLDRLVAALQSRWATALGGPKAHYDSDEVRDAVLEAFAAPRPGWRGAVQHSPDVLLAAKDADAVRAGDFHWVLGEVHPGVNTMRSALFVSQHPDPAQLREAMRRDMAGPRVVLTTTREQGGTPQRLADALVLPHDLRIVFGHDSCGPDLAGAVPVGACSVVEVDGRLRARSRDGRVDLELVELLNEQIMAQLVQKFRLLPAGAHTPRVTLDRLVVARESWRLPPASCKFAFAPDEPSRFLGAQAWRREHGVPRFVFVKSPIEHKPFYVDLESGPSVELFAHAVRALEREEPDAPLAVGEMLPGPDALWLTDAEGNRHTAEFRLVAVDRRGWHQGGTR
ncbi:hypothetical protein GCM10010492_05790 [Saccharothrix mutabilis subsp. mutabilis]|uniref:Carrier domain-containing protein n=1 Tax=Saccharothrix mutabilis subsp. mutabilis TaxID=66855 RepID=A0ABN0T3A6_9PSEU